MKTVCRFKKFTFLSLAAFFFVAAALYPASGYAAGTGGITVSAAISLKNAFEEIGRLFTAQNGGAKVTFNFGASGDLIRQIEQGAPVDVFASAAEKEMNEIDKKGLIVPGTRSDFAGNNMVLIVPGGKFSGKAVIKNFSDLAGAGVTRIAVGNPAVVPAGRYAEAVLRYFRLLPAIQGKLVYGGNVRQVLGYVMRGEVDAALVYSTDAAIVSGQVRVAAIAPPASHKPILYPMAAIKGSANGRLATAFMSLVKSAQGRTILEKYGFQVISR